MKKKTLVWVLPLALLALLVAVCTSHSSPEGEYTEAALVDYFLTRSPWAMSFLLPNCVDDSLAAQAIGDAIIRAIAGEEEFSQLINAGVGYDKNRGLWIVNRRSKIDDPSKAYTCVIRRKDGQIVKVWFNED